MATVVRVPRQIPGWQAAPDPALRRDGLSVVADGPRGVGGVPVLTVGDPATRSILGVPSAAPYIGTFNWVEDLCD